MKITRKFSQIGNSIIMLNMHTRQHIIAELPLKKKIQVKTELGILLELTPHTLVPHPNTFQLIQMAQKIVSQNRDIQTIADPGTGSGVIAISLAKHFPDKRILASDVSKKALKTTKKNMGLNKISTIIVFQNTSGYRVWLKELIGRTVDFIVANPPFIGRKEYYSPEFVKHWPEALYEPKSAILTSDPEGLEPFLKIFKNASLLKTKYILFECNALNIDKLELLLKKKSKSVEIYKDQEGQKRFLFITLHGSKS